MNGYIFGERGVKPAAARGGAPKHGGPAPKGEPPSRQAAGPSSAPQAPDTARIFPAASRSASLRSVCSQVNDFSVRPKWP